MTSNSPIATPQLPDHVRLVGYKWSPALVEPGIRDRETGEFITPGWYVLGTGEDHDPRDPAQFIIHIEWAYDDDGQDITGATARRIADALSMSVEGEMAAERRGAGQALRTASARFNPADFDGDLAPGVGFARDLLARRAEQVESGALDL